MAVFASALASIVLFLAAAGPSRPWTARRPPVRPTPAHELTSLDRWPPEPDSPTPVDPARFAQAFTYFCGRPQLEEIGKLVLAAAKEADVDPFLLAALVRERSRCDARRKIHEGYGLLGLQPDMYLGAGAPPLPIDPRALAVPALFAPEHNLRVGARLLRMWEDLHPGLDATFGGVPHRTGVAHFIWGDRVNGSGNEDAVFTARRRLIDHYTASPEPARPTPVGLEVVSPLEGVPRVASSGPGEDRDGGLRRHRGLDIVASDWEPVRSVAAGTVIFAGVNLYGSPRRGPIPPDKIGRYRNRRMGAGGIYLCIRHDLPAGSSAKNVVTCYMHLNSYTVAAGERVEGGQTIGFVGRTGVHSSPSHLHFEVRVDDQAKNPARYLSDLVIPPKATKTYHHVMALKRARLRASRRINSSAGF